jgi:hypothetical protein
MTVARPDRLAAAPPVTSPAEPEAPRGYADFSRPIGSAPTAQPASPAPAGEEPPRGYADFSRPMTSPARPTASTAAPARTPAPAVAAADGPRRYSVHREYGMQPDQPQIPETFFLDSAGGEDLAAPPPPPMSDRDERRVRAAAADPDAPGAQ